MFRPGVVSGTCHATGIFHTKRQIPLNVHPGLRQCITLCTRKQLIYGLWVGSWGAQSSVVKARAAGEQVLCVGGAVDVDTPQIDSPCERVKKEYV